MQKKKGKSASGDFAATKLRISSRSAYAQQINPPRIMGTVVYLCCVLTCGCNEGFGGEHSTQPERGCPCRGGNSLQAKQLLVAIQCACPRSQVSDPSGQCEVSGRCVLFLPVSGNSAGRQTGKEFAGEIRGFDFASTEGPGQSIHSGSNEGSTMIVRRRFNK